MSRRKRKEQQELLAALGAPCCTVCSRLIDKTLNPLNIYYSDLCNLILCSKRCQRYMARYGWYQIPGWRELVTPF